MAAETLLALWNDTPTRQAIVDFVQAVSNEGSPGDDGGDNTKPVYESAIEFFTGT